MRTLALPKHVEHWSLTTIREKLVKIGAKVVAHGRYVTFQMAEVTVPVAICSGTSCGGSIDYDDLSGQWPERREETRESGG